MTTPIAQTNGPDQSPARLVRHRGRMVMLNELSGSEIAAELSPKLRSEVSARLGINCRAKAIDARDPLARAKIVAAAVANAPACKGKASQALALLADDELADLPGSAIVKMLSSSPSKSGDPEAAARAEMKAALARQGNSQISAFGGSGSTNGTQSAAAVWDQAGRANFGQDWGK